MSIDRIFGAPYHWDITTAQERKQGIGAADFHWPYPMEGGWDSSAGHVYAQAIREANEMRRAAFASRKQRSIAYPLRPGYFQPVAIVLGHGVKKPKIGAWTDERYDGGGIPADYAVAPEWLDDA